MYVNMYVFVWYYMCVYKYTFVLAQLAGAVEYTDCTSAEGKEPLNECPGYVTKQYDGEIPVMLGFGGMRSTPSLPLLPGPLWPGMIAPDRALSMC